MVGPVSQKGYQCWAGRKLKSKNGQVRVSCTPRLLTSDALISACSSPHHVSLVLSFCPGVRVVEQRVSGMEPSPCTLSDIPIQVTCFISDLAGTSLYKKEQEHSTPGSRCPHVKTDMATLERLQMYMLFEKKQKQPTVLER